MTLLWVVAGLILGIGILIYFLISVRRQRIRDEINAKVLVCPSCAARMTGESFSRSGPRGLFMTCASCGNRSTWDFSINPPTLKSSERKRRF